MTSVVLLTVDCLRADHVGCYGYERPTTPNIDTFADSSTIFAYSYSNCPGTRWAFQSLHTGMHAARIRGLGIPEEYPHVLGQQFRENGFKTGGFAYNGFISREYGYDQGFDTYYGVEDFSDNLHPLRRFGKRLNNLIDSDLINNSVPEISNRVLNRFQEWKEDAYRSEVPDPVIADHAIDWITTQQAAGEDFFAWIHFMNAHTPYGRYDDHLKKVRGDSAIEHTIHPGNEDRISIGTEPEDTIIDTYDANIRSVDQQIGRLLQVVDSDTVVAITGDHGEEFGKYNPFHTESFFSSMTQVPLIIRSHGLETGVITDYPVQHLDIPPTLLSAADITVPHNYEGEILQRTQRRSDAPIFFSLSEDRVAVRVGEWKFIKDEGVDELYHTPHGGDDTSPVQKNEKRTRLMELLSEFGNDISDYNVWSNKREFGDEELSTTVKENLEELGYIG